MMQIRDEHNSTVEVLRAIINHVPYGILAIDHQKNISMANSQAVKMIGKSQTDLIGLPLSVALEKLEDPELKLDHILRRKKLTNFESFDVRLSNSHLTLNGVLIDGGMMITIADITDIREMEAEGLNALLEGQEQERRRIAREIHDGIGPMMSAIKMNLAAIESELNPLDPQLRKRFNDSNKIIDDAADDLRSISHNLIPRALFDFGLIDALTSLLEKIGTGTSIEIKFIVTGFEQRLDQVMELGLYRICQELVNNSVKYANAQTVTVQLTRGNDNIQLMYEDNGIGFDPGKDSDGIGLINIQNRAKAFGGEAIIDSHPGKGMTATIEIPIDEA